MPKLTVIAGPMTGRVFELRGDIIFLGRSRKNDIRIRDASVSRKQMKIFQIGNKLFVEDLKSTNGTALNNKMIQPGEGYEIWEGDLITMGNSILRLDEAAPRKALNKGSWK